MTVESIIQGILSSRGDLTREQIVKMIDEKVKGAKGYFTPEFAAQMVASELGGHPPQANLQQRVLIKDLVSGLSDVTLTGRILHTSPIQIFTRSDGAESRVKRLVMADKSGTITVVLWDDKAKLAEDEDLRPGQIVRFSHCYVREGFDGKTELNLGELGEVEALHRDELKDEYPPLESFIRGIGEITRKDKRVNVFGVVQRTFPESTFKRKDGSEGRRRHLWLRDSTGAIGVTFWDSKVLDIEDLREGAHLRVMNARVKSRLDAQLELHVENASNVEATAENPSDLRLLPAEVVKAKEITDRMSNTNVAGLKDGEYVTVEGTVLAKPITKGVTTRRNERVKVSSFELSNSTGKVEVSLWRELTEIAERLSAGDRLEIRNIHVRRGPSGLKLSSTMLTSIRILSKQN